jgi:hypothetical protein
MATLVNFYIDEEGEVFAYFPQLKYNDKFKTCYAHIGQHSACHVDYVRDKHRATLEQYQPLYNELTQIGYNLRVCKNRN